MNSTGPAQRWAGVCLFAGLWLALLTAPLGPARAQAADQTLTLTILGTTDVHGNVWPFDYLRGEPAERGLAKVAAYVKQVRARQPNVLLVDSGDTFQGTPLAFLYADEFAAEPNPVVAAMNAMGYDAMAVGNHEFNFGLRVLWRLKEQVQFPMLAANVVSTYHDSRRDFAPYVIRTVSGVRVAILGMVTPNVPSWEPPAHLVGYEFRDLVETAKRIVPELRRKADVVVLILHSGLGPGAEADARRAALHPGENRALKIAQQVPSPDVMFVGHSHREMPGREVDGVLLVQAKYWAQSVAEVELDLARAGGRWQIAGKRSRVVPMDSSVAADPEVLELTRAAHERTERALKTVVGELSEELSARTGRIEEGPLLEIIQRAQLRAGHADVSLAALFSTATRWTASPVTLRDVYALYPYENQLYTIEVTGAQLKEALEYSARSFKTWPWPAGSSPFADLPETNFDMAEGVSYQIDLSQPPGMRIVNLTFDGQPLAPERKLRLALNSYRWAGGGNYEMLRHAKVVEETNRGVRQLIVDYLLEQKKIATRADHNWEIIPAEARQAILDSVAPPSAVVGSN